MKKRGDGRVAEVEVAGVVGEKVVVDGEEAGGVAEVEEDEKKVKLECAITLRLICI